MYRNCLFTNSSILTTLSKGPLSSSSGSVFAAVPGVPRLPPGKKPPGPPPGPPPAQVLALYGIPTRRSFFADTGMISFFFFFLKVGIQREIFELYSNITCCLHFSLLNFTVLLLEPLIPGFDKDSSADFGQDLDSSSESDRDQDNVDDDKSDSDADSKEDGDEGGDGNQRMSLDRQDDDKNREERDRSERQSGESLRFLNLINSSLYVLLLDKSNKMLLSN